MITREELQSFGYLTLADALQGVRGIFLSNDRIYTYIGVRGFSPPGDLNTRIAILWDGHVMNDDLLGSSGGLLFEFGRLGFRGRQDSGNSLAGRRGEGIATGTGLTLQAIELVGDLPQVRVDRLAERRAQRDVEERIDLDRHADPAGARGGRSACRWCFA